jgi:hypothetical protein
MPDTKLSEGQRTVTGMLAQERCTSGQASGPKLGEGMAKLTTALLFVSLTKT